MAADTLLGSGAETVVSETHVGNVLQRDHAVVVESRTYRFIIEPTTTASCI